MIVRRILLLAYYLIIRRDHCQEMTPILISCCDVNQTWVARDFRSEVLITIISFFFETIVAALITLVAEWDNPSVWVPTGRIVLIAITFGVNPHLKTKSLFVVATIICTT